MKIWASNDKELRFTEVDTNYLAVNVFTEEFIIGLMLSRRETEKIMCVACRMVRYASFLGIVKKNEPNAYRS